MMRVVWLLVLALGHCCAGPTSGQRARSTSRKGAAVAAGPAILSVSRPSQGLVMMRLRHNSLDHMKVRRVSIEDGEGFTWHNQRLASRRNGKGDYTLRVGIDPIAGPGLPASLPWKVTLHFEKFKNFGEADDVHVPFQQSFADGRFRLKSDSPLFEKFAEGWALDPSTREFRVFRSVARIDDFVFRPLRVEWKGGATAFPEADSNIETVQSGPVPGDATDLVMVARRCRYVVWRPITVGAATLEPQKPEAETGL